jgi:hypothetical protein
MLVSRSRVEGRTSDPPGDCRALSLCLGASRASPVSSGPRGAPRPSCTRRRSDVRCVGLGCRLPGHPSRDLEGSVPQHAPCPFLITFRRRPRRPRHLLRELVSGVLPPARAWRSRRPLSPGTLRRDHVAGRHPDARDREPRLLSHGEPGRRRVRRRGVRGIPRRQPHHGPAGDDPPRSGAKKPSGSPTSTRRGRGRRPAPSAATSRPRFDGRRCSRGEPADRADPHRCRPNAASQAAKLPPARPCRTGP